MEIPLLDEDQSSLNDNQQPQEQATLDRYSELIFRVPDSPEVHALRDSLDRTLARSREDPALPNSRDGYRDATSNIRLPLLLFSDDDADTLVFIDIVPAIRLPCRAALPAPQSRNIPHRIHSRSLLKSGSKYFRDQFSPKRQAKVRKRRNLTGQLPKGINYVLDLTPSEEGDEALISITQLSCPMGIRTWASQRVRWGLPSSCVGGIEEVEYQPGAEEPSSLGLSPPPLPTSEPPVEIFDELDVEGQTQEPMQARDEGQPQQSTCAEDHGIEPFENCQVNQNESSPRKKSLPLDYSGFRHCTCIERVLHALENLGPRLDSAPKWWTFFALAELFDVATDPTISSCILAWLFELSNLLFIELHPEISHRVACGIQSNDLCRETFAILVGEEALLLLHNSKRTPSMERPSETLHGRLRDTLADSELQRVEYASKSFLERIIASFINLTGTEMPWVMTLVGRQLNLERVPPPIVLHLVQYLKEYIRYRICQFLSQPLDTHVVMQADFFSSLKNGYPDIHFLRTYAEMEPIERILSRTFWLQLGRKISVSDYDTWDPMCRSIMELGDHLPLFKDQGDAIVRRVQLGELRYVVNTVNQSIGPSITGPTNILTSANPNTPKFLLDAFLDGADQYLRDFGSEMLQAPLSQRSGNNFDIRFNLVDTLTCLGDNEYKFLPLWAGGNDDGTGGVFADEGIPIPPTGGFSAPGPHIHNGRTTPNPTVDSFSAVRASEVLSTLQEASRRAMDYSATEVISIESTSEPLREGMARFNLGSFGSQGTVEGEFSLIDQDSAEEDDVVILADDSCDDSSDTAVMETLSTLDREEGFDLNDDVDFDLECEDDDSEIAQVEDDRSR